MYLLVLYKEVDKVIMEKCCCMFAVIIKKTSSPAGIHVLWRN